MDLTELLGKSSEFQQIDAAIKPGKRQLVTGVAGSGMTLLLAALFGRHRHCQLVVVDSLFHMEDLAVDLTNLLPEERVYQFPVEEDLPTEIATSSPNYRAQRVLALNALLYDEHAIVITTAAGMRRNLVDPAAFSQGTLTIKAGGEVDPQKISAQLLAMGYTRQKMVLRPGDFAIRGSIIDIYALNTDNPVRIDLFDTEVDSLRYFDASSQRSISNLEEITILPATDFLVLPDRLPAIIKQLGVDRDQLLAAIDTKNDQQRDAIAGKYNQLLSELKKQQVPTELLAYTNLVYQEHHSLVDYLDKQGIIYVADWDRIKERLKRLAESEERWLNSQVKAHQRVDKEPLGNDVAALIKQPTQSLVFLALLKKGMGGARLDQLTELTSRTMQRFLGQMPLLKAELNRWHEQGQTVVLMANSPERRKQVARTLDDFHIPIVEAAQDQLQEHHTQLVDASMANGFEMPAANLVVITEGEMFKQVKKRHPRRQQLANAERIKSYTDLKPGDYVVHVNHGIGLFAGIKTLEVDGVHQDYIVIDYRNHDQVFVPVTQLHLVQKYVGGSEDRHPRLNKLGGSEWAKTKRRVAAKIENIADELVDLYAKRRLEKGYAFPKDDYLQERFDQDFPYTETPDQNRSIKEIKEDMETTKPMDRLLVGDVGYGKTEVAMRAAFKAVTGGKQVAMLVPTTVLAQQHYDTFSARFAGFPVKIEMLSRFKTRQETKMIERDIADGKIDIVIGTHRLLSKDINFHDLGLLIVDEEQRFGVKHKERLKQLKANVDVLTLTATPIPRTLHMSLLGVRDLSVLETPPAGRYPIQTYVMEQNAGAIRDGIIREIQRGGQVYYLHNRVSDIEKVVANLQQLVPEARIAYIHGQMTENQLESVLYDFVRGESDVLVTTSIIETGVDIPNVNTLFVENADRLGLSQLYQIRGRIGRSNRVAYAYFMYQPNKVLTEQGEKRLAAIRDFTELGSGFKIAMRDLSIRGAGNLLGKQQHGFIDSVGYDLYSEMLADAVAKKRGEKRAEKTNTEVELGVEAYLPDDYVSDQRQKIELYKDIRKAHSDEDLLNLQGDLIDRFGDYGPAVDNLLKIGKLKMHADLAMLDKITRRRDQLTLRFSQEASRTLTGKQVLSQLAKTKFKATLDQDDDGRLSLRLVIQPWMKEADWLDQLQLLVSGLATLMQGEGNENKPTPAPDH
ncbi:transcription-repair coupling factor [uncultured Limosilactobacillus sp.]|uniref:transcription-repair coupling factor n=1 Tax=uncultured Limosilactobacillus sp. TaxID=2837629 RepID=UPI0025E842EE|nr:transcription-repair coupling factor [uncultured Limosilactobacillus sp.]